MDKMDKVILEPVEFVKNLVRDLNEASPYRFPDDAAALVAARDEAIREQCVRVALRVVGYNGGLAMNEASRKGELIAAIRSAGKPRLAPGQLVKWPSGMLANNEWMYGQHGIDDKGMAFVEPVLDRDGKPVFLKVEEA